MDREISSTLRNIFLVHLVVSAVLGIPMWLVPGRTLQLVGWVPELWEIRDGLTLPGTMRVDPFVARLVGSALLALAYASYRGWRAGKWGEVALVVQLETVYCVLGFVAFVAGIIRTGAITKLPLFGWVVLVILAAFAVAWGWSWRQHTRG